MINWIQKTFHTDKWWGKIIFIGFVYIIYWLIFYGSWFSIPDRYFDHNTEVTGILFIIYIFIIVPSISFLIPPSVGKVFPIKNSIIYPLHIFLIILSIAIFLAIGITVAFSHIQIG